MRPEAADSALPHATASGSARPDPTGPARFDDAFRAGFDTLLRWRRDVRHFSPEPLPAPLVEELLDAACLAPSVGNARPWRFVSVDSPDRRAAIGANFAAANHAALAGYTGDRARTYATLKLAGLREAPQQFAVFCEEQPVEGYGLGRATMPETLRYSAVLAVHTLWLAARAHGVGVGWVSILDPVAAAATLEVPPTWRLVAYLCLGYPLAESETPELERLGWQARTGACREVLRR
ncbi:5,6-dimethylbenzimidazole synthase [Longispora sp. NPDC051575]|uniref:5,6-dimethylbenzimidazole synthase n=1 Tax=Longispora sp. NPDC051575 TaxID=3154943 RepID=UPI0034294981